jgi:hypothetical protein
MPNMSYIRFENTASDLADCLEHLHDDLSESETAARRRLIALAREIVADTEDEEVDEEDAG